MEAAAAPELPFKYQTRLAGGVAAWETDALAEAPENPCFVHCSVCDKAAADAAGGAEPAAGGASPGRSFIGMPGLQEATLTVRCSVCDEARYVAAAAEQREPEPPPPAADVPESVPGVYKSSDDAARLADKIKHREADKANFAAMGPDFAPMIAMQDAEIAQLSARKAALEAGAGAAGGGGAGAALPEAVPPSGFVLAPQPSLSFASLVNGSLRGVCHSAACAGATTTAKIEFGCAGCGKAASERGECYWLPQLRRAREGEECCICLMEVDEPPIEGGTCPPAVVVFDPCGCVADVTMFAEQVKQGIQSGGGMSVSAPDPSV